VSTDTSSLPSLDRLPSGRHHLTREDVQRSQRGRLLVAMLQSVGDRGYATTTVGDVVAIAAVSRTTFYEQFIDKEACFLAAFNFGVEHMLSRMGEAWERHDAGAGWRARLRSDLTAYLDALASEPAFAISLHVEVLAAGPAALEQRAQMLGLFATRTARLNELARTEEPDLPELPPEVFALHTGGLDELIRDRLRTQPPDTLPALAEPVLTATFSLFGTVQNQR
jgi:AcrR family transcriptional regulator